MTGSRDAGKLPAVEKLHPHLCITVPDAFPGKGHDCSPPSSDALWISASTLGLPESRGKALSLQSFFPLSLVCHLLVQL